MSVSSKLLIDEEPLQVLPSLAARVGLNRATFLQQLHYWLKKKSAHVRDGRRWIYNTFEDWHEQFPFWSIEAIRKIVSQLRAKGLILTTSKYNERKGDRTLWYTIEYEAFNALFEGADESTEASDQPDKSTQQPDKSTDLEPDKSTQRYQRVPESNNRDSVLQTGEPLEAAPPIKKEEKAEPPGKFANRRNMEMIAEARKRGRKLHEPTSDEKNKLGSQFAAEFRKREIEDLERALHYRVAKAAGEISGEYASWCSLRTALDRVDEGWRPGRHLQPVRERREYDKHDARRDPEDVAEVERLMREAGIA